MDKTPIMDPKNPTETLLIMSSEGNKLIVSDCINFDVSHSDTIFAAVKEELFKDETSYNSVDFDFSKTQNLTSAALRHFSQLLEDCQVHGDKKLSIHHASVNVAKLINLSGYGAVLNMVDTQEE